MLDGLQLAGIILGTLSVGLIVGTTIGYHTSTIDHHNELNERLNNL